MYIYQWLLYFLLTCTRTCIITLLDGRFILTYKTGILAKGHFSLKCLYQAKRLCYHVFGCQGNRIGIYFYDSHIGFRIILMVWVPLAPLPFYYYTYFRLSQNRVIYRMSILLVPTSSELNLTLSMRNYAMTTVNQCIGNADNLSCSKIDSMIVYTTFSRKKIR